MLLLRPSEILFESSAGVAALLRARGVGMLWGGRSRSDRRQHYDHLWKRGRRKEKSMDCSYGLQVAFTGRANERRARIQVLYVFCTTVY